MIAFLNHIIHGFGEASSTIRIVSDANPNRHALRPNKNIGILAQEN